MKSRLRETISYPEYNKNCSISFKTLGIDASSSHNYYTASLLN